MFYDIIYIGGKMLDNLNKEQIEAVMYKDGPLLVMAGAGSGKTKVLTTRIAYLIENGVDPFNILAITFTNKAAREMQDRIFSLIQDKAKFMQISTFHSFGLTIIKRYYEFVGLSKNFTIVDNDDTMSLVKKLVKDAGYDIKTYNPKTIRNKISSAKNELLTPDELAHFSSCEFDDVVVEIYRLYQKKLLSNNSVDFDDLLVLPIKIFKENKEILKIYQEQYKYILIDEYQDTNHVQYVLTKMLSAKYKNICVVGDQDQSIYGFRGSNYRNILNFEKDYPNAKVIMLEQNYRSTKNILNAANDIISHNKKRKEKNLWTDNIDGDKIVNKRCTDEKDEAYYVVNKISELVSTGVNHDDIAILYRTNAQSRNIEEAMLGANIPYKIVGSFYFYNRREIKDLISYLRLIYNTSDNLSLTRIINVPKRKIGLKTIEKITEKAMIENTSLFDTIDSGKELKFKELIQELIIASENLSLTELVDEILDKTGIRKELEKEGTIESIARLENLDEFKSITKGFEHRYGIVSLEDFLNEISLVADVEEVKDNKDVVTMMTVHAAKGLEFDYVFIVGLEEGIFPHNRSFFDDDEMEEERRLCYVAVTRARKKLFLLSANMRMLYGMEQQNPKSRFLSEINEDYLENVVVKKQPFKNTKNINQYEEYKLSEKIMHKDFGEGVIVGIDKSILTIAFPFPAGIKKIMKGHSSIAKIS